ncbi:ABC transporter ATP-binding protein [Rufibacter soli]
MIHLQDIHKYYAVAGNKLHVLKGIDLQIQEGELVSVLGAAGSGKSTLLNILGVLDEFDRGHYTLAGSSMKNLSQAGAAHFRNKFLGFVLQSFDLISFQNILENVALPLQYQNVDRQERNQLALECLDRVGLKDWAQHSPADLSAGQRQQVAIARALIGSPKLILADEPTGGLDTHASKVVMETLKEVNRQGITVVLATQEKSIAEQATRRFRLKDGRLREGNPGKSAISPLSPMAYTRP